MTAHRDLVRAVAHAATLAIVLLSVPSALGAPSAEQRAAALADRMTPAEKLNLVASGAAGVPRLGIPALSAIDGPNGVGTNSAGVTAFPNAVNVGASWDPRLARAYGAALGAEVRAKGHVLLFAPTINIIRTPLWGRAAESFSEDPFLAAALVAPEVQGIQSARVMAEPKHYAGNNQEFGRIGIPVGGPGVDDRVSLRALQEIYLPAFRAAVQTGGAASVMCSYNRINGIQSCQNRETLGILKRQFGLRGFVEPDAVIAVRDTAAAVNAGVDNLQLGGGAGLAAAVAAGTVSQQRLDDAVQRILVGQIRAGVLDAPTARGQPVASTPAHRALATRISAEASVLLQNRDRVLPLTRRDRRIAVIGYDAGPGTQIEEGGSPAVRPGTPIITPLSGIRARAPRGVAVSYAPGTLGVVTLPPVPASVLTPPSGSGHGLSATFYAAKTPSFSGPPIAARVDPVVDASAALPAGAGAGRWTGTLTPPGTGVYRFSLTVTGHARLLIGGRPVVVGDTEWVNLNSGAPDQTFQGRLRLRAGHPVPITVEYALNQSVAGSRLQLGWQPPDRSLRERAVAAARRADVAIVFANDVTGEGMDRTSLSLPGDQDELIEAVAAANPRTVVVLHTASAVLMPWRDRVAGIIEAWYPGQQTGQAIAKTLFGDVDPSGRLPVTFPASDGQGPTAGRPDRYPGIGNVVHYAEGIFVGYRWYDQLAQTPLFPFGYGLSYTTFRLSRFTLSARRGGRYGVGVRIRNIGRRTGAEVVQVYVGFPRGTGEPPRQLKAFTKVWLAPGLMRTIRLMLPAASFEMFAGARHGWRRVPGTYGIYAGTSSRQLTLVRAIRLR